MKGLNGDQPLELKLAVLAKNKVLKYITGREINPVIGQ